MMRVRIAACFIVLFASLVSPALAGKGDKATAPAYSATNSAIGELLAIPERLELSIGPGNFPITFRQNPGPKNALGKVKFMLPNKHNIYLHDTPAKDKFLQVTRAFSHGCIRLSRPVALAYTVLGEFAGWTKARADGVWAGGKTTRVPVSQHIPVHLIYATAFMGDGGLIEFRSDVYGRDRKLYNALFGRPTS